jgi:putative IMPACT (imprinted ancient) family translation regulator
MIDRAGVDEACVAVVRYFGGTKLGTAGLSRCYREAARGAIEGAGKVEVIETERFAVSVPYERIDSFKRFLLSKDVTLESESFTEKAEFVFLVRKSRVKELLKRLAEERIGTASPFPSSLRSPAD